MKHPPPYSREEIAKAEIGHTDSTRGINWFLLLVFVATISVVPLLQSVVEFRDLARARAKARAVHLPAPGRILPQAFDVFSFLHPTWSELDGVVHAGSARARFEQLRQVNNRMLRDIKAYETALKDRDVSVQWLVPHMQRVLAGFLKGGNEDVYCGRDGWLFYRRDIDCLTGRGFLDPAVLKARAATGNELKAPPQPDPVKAILAFDAQLKKRGIRLVILPMPSKAGIHPEEFSGRYADFHRPLQNPSFATFKAKVEEAGVLVFDASRILLDRKLAAGSPAFLATDTHWRPDAMEAVAAMLGDYVARNVALPVVPEPADRRVDEVVTNLGDLAVMLRLPDASFRNRRENVAIHPVVNARGEFWSASRNADVLLLGDSFSNIYSLDAMGWGSGAGFVEQVSFVLKRPLDRIVRNDAGAFATREMLARELAQGRDRLAGKKLVIWEFAVRELTQGDWKPIDLKSPEEIEAIRAKTGRGSSFFAAAAGHSVKVSGVVQGVSSVPRPGSVPYKDHILAVHMTELEGLDAPVNGRDAVVYMWSMRDNKLLPAARYRSGDRLTLELKSWADVAGRYESINRSELDAEELQLQEPNWGEEVVR